MPLWTVNKPIEKNNIISYTEEFKSPLLEARNGSYTNQVFQVLELEDQINALLEMFWKLEKTVKETSSKNEILE